MAIVKVITKNRGLSGESESKGSRRFAVHYQVVTDDLNDGPQTVGIALGLSPFDVYGYGNDVDPGARAKTIRIERSEDDPYHWDVEISYDSNVEQFPDDPLSRPTLIAYSFAQFQQVATKDVNGKAIVNSAAFYFDPPPEIDQSRLVITMTRNEPIFDPILAVAYQDSINEDYWFGFAPGLVKIQNLNGTPEQENGQYFYRVVYEFHVRWDGWKLSVLDQGFYYRDGSGSHVIKDADSQPIVEPALLDGSGGILSSPSPATAKYLNFDVYRSTTFGNLGLP